MLHRTSFLFDIPVSAMRMLDTYIHPGGSGSLPQPRRNRDMQCELCGSVLNAAAAKAYEVKRDAEKKALIKQAEIDAKAKAEAAFERKMTAQREEWEKEEEERDAANERKVA